MKLYTFLIVGVLSLNVSAQSYTSLAGDTVPVRVYANTGLFFPNITTSLRLDSDAGLGTNLGLEDDFNFDATLAVFYAQAIYRVKRRTQFVASFTSMLRSSKLSIDERIEVADTAFDIGADLRMRFDVRYYAFTWRYSVFEHPNWNAGFSLGLRAAQFAFRADATVNGAEFGTQSSVLAPAVLVGLHGSGYLTPRLLSRYSIEYFGLSIQSIDINVLETRVSLEYFITKSIGLGVAYSTSDYRINEVPVNDNFNGRILFAFSGGNVFLTGRF